MPAGTTPSLDDLPSDTLSELDSVGPDAQFEVLRSPYSLLSASLSPSQPLYTRRGTLVAASGKVENAVSTLSVMEPVRRAALGIPFLYQKITSATPITALISTKSALSSFAVVHLDGTTDWMIAQRQGLLAWSGQTLSIRPRINTQLSVAHWGSSQATGRGLLALVGQGQIYQVLLKQGEQYVVHPSNVVAYAVTKNPPLPYRFKSTVLRLQIPDIGFSRLVQRVDLFRNLAQSDTWKGLRKFLFTVRTWSRRTIWGDRLFLQFHGPSTILIQTRASRLSETLTTRDVNEIADAEPGVVQSVTLETPETKTANQSGKTTAATAASVAPTTRVSYASVGKDRKVQFGDGTT